MDASKLLGLLVVMFVIELNMADKKSYSKPSSYVQSVADDVVPKERNLLYKTVLNVALFPFIPDLDGDNHGNLLLYIKTEYEKLYPDVQVIFRPMNTSDGFYNASEVSQWLEGPGYIWDLVEIDTVVLGELVHAGVAAPYYLPSKYPSADWHPAAISAVTVNNEIYAYPHLLCAILLFTRDNTVASSVTIDDLVRSIGTVQAYSSYRLVGNLGSSWDATALYLDSYKETNFPYTDLYGSLDSWKNSTLETLRKIAQLCSFVPGTSNPCIDGYFDETNYDGPAQIFGRGYAAGMYGYSERLHHVLKQIPFTSSLNHNMIQIKPMPLGQIPNEPLFFTDAFVFRRGMSYDKLTAARNFVEFMATPKMQAAVVGAEETARNKYPPRYLLPVSRTAYNVHPLSSDYFFQNYFRYLNGHNLPNRGMNKLRQLGKPIVFPYLNTPY